MKVDPANRPKTTPLQKKVVGILEHNTRFKLHNELHMGPCELLEAPTHVSHFALLIDDDETRHEHRMITQLCEHYSVTPPPEDVTHFTVKLGTFRFKWERHTEFSNYTFFIEAPFDTPFLANAIDQVPSSWLEGLPGEVIAATHIAIESNERPHRSLDELAHLFTANTLMGAEVTAGAAIVWTDNKIHADGFGRILIHDVDLRARQAGRMVQRLIEIETYRMLAMRPVSMARKYIPVLADFDERLAELTSNNSALDCLEDERKLLDDITHLAAEIERISAQTTSRFNASLAYHHIVKQRVTRLRENRIQGLQMFHEFMDQRLTGSIQTCSSVQKHLETLSNHVSRASSLLRTRVEISMEEQSRDLLQSMDNRVKLQLRLQETVEGLSVVVLSYYLLGIVGYGLKGLKSAGIPLNVELSIGIAIPVVVGAVFYSMRRMRKVLKH